MIDPLTLAVILIILAILLFGVELFIPSGGLIGFLSVCCMIGGLISLFWVNTTLGVVATIITLIVTPFAVGLGLKIIPNTPIGRRLTLHHVQKANATVYESKRDTDDGRALVGKTGVALSELRPAGTCRIDGQRLDCMAETGLILPGTAVRVTRVGGMEIKVRPVE
jgi:membrane-bound serine protease (ClpP class)